MTTKTRDWSDAGKGPISRCGQSLEAGKEKETVSLVEPSEELPDC